ncbi:Splicing factor [Polyrhizophydium stewartii]|uniref:Splicing factor n=1 Tax=Polyrhizophydium stewartii TaxID=2732419 RepID=A0ABR4NGE4_9FUNG
MSEKGAARLIGFEATPVSGDWLRGSPIDSVLEKLQSWERSNASVHISAAGPTLSHVQGDSTPHVLRPDAGSAQRALDKETALGHFLATLDTPLVSIMNDPHGLGISIHAPVRIATEHTAVSLPDSVLHGLQHVGMSFFLSRLSSGISFARYMIATGHELNGMEAVLAGFATHFVPEERLPALIDKLSTLASSDLRDIHEAVHEFSADSPDPEILRAWAADSDAQRHFERCFRWETLPEILEALKNEESDWALQALEQISRRNQENIKISLELLQLAAASDLVTSIQTEFVAHQRTAGQEPSAAKLLHDKTFTDHVHRTVTELPRAEDVRLVVTGEHQSSGGMALTKEEVISWFKANWFDFRDQRLSLLGEIQPTAPGSRFLVSEYAKIPAVAEGKQRDQRSWALVHRVSNLVDANCIADKGGEQMKSDSMSDGSSDSGSDFADAAASPEAQALAANPLDYDAHVAMVAAQAAAGDLDGLRASREAMSAVFPLAPDMWLAWIDDERRLAAEPDEKEHIVRLFERAVADYPVISVWQAYVAYLIEEYEAGVEDGTPWITLDRLRLVFAAALKSLGKHFSKGHLVWNAIKDFELALLEDIARVRSMFLDRLKTPHEAIDGTLYDYSPFETSHGGDKYTQLLIAATRLAETTKRGLRAREMQEQKLTEAGQSFEAFCAYIAFERKQPNGGDVERIQTLFERAIEVHCLQPGLWEMYFSFMAIRDKVPTTLVAIAERAVRNCMYSAPLWCNLLRAKTLARRPRSAVLADYNMAISFVALTGDTEQLVSVGLCRCELEKRFPLWDPEASHDTARAGFTETAEYLETVGHADTQLRVHAFGDPDAARSVYHAIVKDKPDSAEIWLEFVQFERMHGQPVKVRSLLRQAAAHVTDVPERVFSEWIDFERTFGEIDTLFEAEDKITIARQRVAKASVASTDAQQAHWQQQRPVSAVADHGNENGAQAGQSAEPHGEHGDGSAAKSKRRQSGDHGDKSPGKRTRQVQDDDETAVDVDMADEAGAKTKGVTAPDLSEYRVINNSMAGNMICVERLSSRTTESDLSKLFGKYGRMLDYFIQPDEETGELEAFVEFADVAAVRKIVLQGPLQLCSETVTPRRCRPAQMIWDFKNEESRSTIYVSGLSLFITKRLLRQVFSEFGKIREIRLMPRKTICFAYIEFETEEEAVKSLVMDQRVIEKSGGRTISVAISDPSKRKIKEVDPKELFVTNLPARIIEEDLAEMFSKYGSVKEVRMPLLPNGKPKGVAFVEFVDEDSAKKALQLNGTQIEDRVMAVTISDPNIRKGKRIAPVPAKASEHGQQRHSAGAEEPRQPPALASQAPTASNAPSTTFAPRSVRAGRARGGPSRKLALAPGLADRAQEASDASGSGAGGSTGTGGGPSKTQDDFRKMLLGGRSK